MRLEADRTVKEPGPLRDSNRQGRRCERDGGGETEGRGWTQVIKQARILDRLVRIRVACVDASTPVLHAGAWGWFQVRSFFAPF